MKHMSIVASVLAMATVSLMVSSCASTARSTATRTDEPWRAGPAPMPQALKQQVVCHKGVQTPPEGIVITQLKVLEAPSKSGVWLGITNIEMNGTNKQLVICLSGYGTFDYNFQEGASDPVLGITFASDEHWLLYQGFESQGTKYGSWGLLFPGKADLSYPPGAFRGSARMTIPMWSAKSLETEQLNWGAVEKSLPLKELWFDGNKITAMQFGGTDGIVVRVVRQP